MAAKPKAYADAAHRESPISKVISKVQQQELDARHLQRRLLPSLLGRAAYEASMPPEQARDVFRDLERAREFGFVFDGCQSEGTPNLHLLYLLTPPRTYGLVWPNWRVFASRCLHSEGGGVTRVMEAIGMTESQLIKYRDRPPKMPSYAVPVGAAAKAAKVAAAQAAVKAEAAASASSAGAFAAPTATAATAAAAVVAAAAAEAAVDEANHRVAIYHRFFNTLLLAELLNERSMEEVSKSYGLKSSGPLQKLLESVNGFSNTVVHFCNVLRYRELASMLTTFGKQLGAGGVQEDLLPLMRVRVLQGNVRSARALYNAGMTDPALLAAASEDVIAAAMLSVTPFAKATGSNAQHKAARKAWHLEQLQKKARAIHHIAAAVVQKQAEADFFEAGQLIDEAEGMYGSGDGPHIFIRGAACGRGRGRGNGRGNRRGRGGKGGGPGFDAKSGSGSWKKKRKTAKSKSWKKYH